MGHLFIILGAGGGGDSQLHSRAKSGTDISIPL